MSTEQGSVKNTDQEDADLALVRMMASQRITRVRVTQATCVRNNVKGCPRMAILDKAGCGEAIGFNGGLVFMYAQCKVYVQLWSRLKAYNRVIFVQNCPDTAKRAEKNCSCTVSMDTKDAGAVPALQTGTTAQPPAEAGPTELIPV